MTDYAAPVLDLYPKLLIDQPYRLAPKTDLIAWAKGLYCAQFGMRVERKFTRLAKL